MAKNIKRLFAMSLVVCMLIAALPMQALAAVSVPSTETSPEGLITDVLTTTDSVPGADGNTVVTVTIQKDTEGTLADGSHLDRSESFESSWTYDENGNLVSNSGINIGSETITEIIVLPDGGIIVKVPSVGEEPNSVKFGDTSLNGTVGDSENYTTTTVTPGQVTVSNGGITYEQKFTDKDGLTYTNADVTPDSDGTSDLRSENSNDLLYVNGTASSEFLPGYEGEVVIPDMVDGYNYIYVGSGNTSVFTPAIVYTEPMDREDKIAIYGDAAYLKPGMSYFKSYLGWMDPEERESIAYNEDGSYVVDDEGYILNKDRQRVVKGEQTAKGPNGEITYLRRFDATGDSHKVEGWYEEGEWKKELNGKDAYVAVWGGPQQFLLVDANGNIITTYCADQTDPTEKNYGYNIENLEDAAYYSEEEAAHIRAIAKNGYWGISSEAGEANPAEGSLEYMKQALIAAGFTPEELASLNDGMALTATQMAIWTFSNKMAGIKFVNAHYDLSGPGGDGWGMNYYDKKDKEGCNYGMVPDEKVDDIQLMYRIYEFLIGLEGVETRGDMADTVITAENAITNMNVNVIQKADGHINNTDNDNTNDAYVTDLSFALVVEPTGSDDESLKVTLITSDGQTIVGRICGAKEKEDEIDLERDGNGNYWFRNIVLTEGGQTFTLNLEGVQNLEQGVYLYSSEVRDGETSQTLVGKAGGVRDFDVSVNLSFSVNVDEGLIVTERVWRNEYDPGYGQEDPVDPEGIVPRWNPPENNRLANEEGEIIEEEEVPLAAPVSTGDNTGLWIALFMMIAFGIVAINIFDKKRHHTTF